MNYKQKTLISGAEALGLTLGIKQRKAFGLYTRELTEWSRKINLTGHRDRESIEIFHYLDSLSLFQTGLIHHDLTVLDLGSGAGFPGLPLKILEPSLRMVLLDASRKRGAFLSFLVRTLGLSGVEIEQVRAEDYAVKTNLRFDLILCRAVTSIEKACSWTAPLLKPDGVYLFQKSRGVGEELRRVASSLDQMGFRILKTQSLDVPFLKRSRYVVHVGRKKKKDFSGVSR